MAWDGIYRPADPPMSGEQVKLIQSKALKAFGSYAVPLGVTINGLYDAATAAFIEEYQRRKNDSGYRPRLPANPTAKPGDCDYESKKALGILPGAPPMPGPTQRYVGYCCPGTWGTWNVGPQIMAINRAPRVQVQGVQWNTSAFLNPDPQHSYIEARTEGAAELMRLALPEHRLKIITGYSMGADVVTRFLLEWPAERRDEILAVIKFGDPGHLPGLGIVGQNSAHGGISRVYTPDWAVGRTYSYQISGDMYGDADGYLPAFYELLTRMEATPAFAGYLFTWLTGIPLTLEGILTATLKAAPSVIGAGMLGLAGNSALPGFGALAPILGMITPGLLTQKDGPISLPDMLLNLPTIIVSLLALMKFVFTSAHGHYWTDPIFDGMTAEDHAASIVRKLTT
jgi:hypothetical protein